MPTFVALLRGINVGKAKRVPMAELRRLLTELGHDEVRTLLNSGNAVFRARAGSADTLARAIAKAVHEQLDVEVPVIVKSAQTLAAIVQANPLADSAPDPSRLLVAFAQDDGTLAQLEALRPLLAASEALHIGAHAAYLHCGGGILESKAGEALLGRIGRAATTRNWATTLKLQALASA